jgi:hypothetical protein
VALAVVSVAWLLVNEPVEGPILFVVVPEHGLTGSDLAGLTGLGLAVWRWPPSPPVTAQLRRAPGLA